MQPDRALDHLLGAGAMDALSAPLLGEVLNGGSAGGWVDELATDEVGLALVVEPDGVRFARERLGARASGVRVVPADAPALATAVASGGHRLRGVVVQLLGAEPKIVDRHGAPWSGGV